MERSTQNPAVCSNSLRYTFRPVVGLAALLLVGGVSWPASATTIKAGARIAVSPTTFVVPIDIADAVNAIGWQVDLTYDASDVLVNTGCDPFSSDPYCSLITGAVTEGDFFASGAPFNLLVPGFVDLDPGTGDQTGLLFAVSGRFGGSAPPFPSGSGTLAFVEFTILGNGTSPIDVVNASVDAVAVPEPTTAILVITGIAATRIRQLSRRRAGVKSR